MSCHRPRLCERLAQETRAKKSPQQRGPKQHRRPRGQPQTPLLSLLPLPEENSDYRRKTQNPDFIRDCLRHLVKQAGILKVRDGSLVLWRQHHGGKPVLCPPERVKELIAEIISALRAYAHKERRWDLYEEGYYYWPLMHAANLVDPGGPYVDKPAFNPLRKDQDLRALAKTLRGLAKRNKVQWAPGNRWDAFVAARRGLVKELWGAFTLCTGPSVGGLPGLPKYGRVTAIDRWIAKILLAFNIRTENQGLGKLMRTVRKDRDRPFSPN